MSLLCYNCKEVNIELSQKENLKVNNSIIKFSTEELTAFCSEECKEEYNERHGYTKKMSNGKRVDFSRMNGKEVQEYSLSRFKEMIKKNR